MIVENVQYISASSELFKRKTPSYALKFFSLLSVWQLCQLLHDYYITYWFCQWYYKNYDRKEYNIGMTEHDDRLWLQIVELVFRMRETHSKRVRLSGNVC